MVIYNKRLEFFRYFYIEILRAPSMCGHKDTKIFLKNFLLFIDCCLPHSFCLVRRYSQIRRVRGTLAEER